MMKAQLLVFAISAILVASIGMTPVFGQSPIVVTTDKESYADGDEIIISGSVIQSLGGYEVGIIVMSPPPLVNRVNLDQVPIDADKQFSTTMTAGGSLMKVDGTYTIKVQYGPNYTATASFEFVGAGGGEEEPVSPSPTTDETYSVEGTDATIGYTITGGKVLSIVPDVEGLSLIIKIEATEDGSITLGIPRAILDARTEGGDDDTEFFVLVDADETDFDEAVTDITRTLTIEFPAGAEEIEIIGTFVIPEFGTIAAMILAVAIISIIAISARSKLSIIPRY